jgi:hypothetical protein
MERYGCSGGVAGLDRGGLDGTYAPSGADPDTLRELRWMQREDRAAEHRPPPSDESVDVEEGDGDPPRRARASHARSGARPAKDQSVAEVVRVGDGGADV